MTLRFKTIITIFCCPQFVGNLGADELSGSGSVSHETAVNWKSDRYCRIGFPCGSSTQAGRSVLAVGRARVLTARAASMASETCPVSPRARIQGGSYKTFPDATL